MTSQLHSIFNSESAYIDDIKWVGKSTIGFNGYTFKLAVKITIKVEDHFLAGCLKFLERNAVVFMCWHMVQMKFIRRRENQEEKARRLM